MLKNCIECRNIFEAKKSHKKYCNLCAQKNITISKKYSKIKNNTHIAVKGSISSKIIHYNSNGKILFEKEIKAGEKCHDNHSKLKWWKGNFGRIWIHPAWEKILYIKENSKDYSDFEKKLKSVLK